MFFLQVLSEELPLLLATLSFKRSMRWNSPAAFSRPLRWLMALHGATALPLHYAGVTAGRGTRLLRNSQHPEFTVRQSWGSVSLGPLCCKEPSLCHQ